MSGLTRERGDTVIGPRTSQSVLSSLLYRDTSDPWKRLNPSCICEIHHLAVVKGQRRESAARTVGIATRRAGWRPFGVPSWLGMRS